MPAISVLMPVYNGYDGSIDQTEELIEKYRIIDDRIRITQDLELVTRLSKIGTVINTKDKLVISQLPEDSVSKEKLTSQQNGAITIALSNAYPELSYLKYTSQFDLPVILPALKDNRHYFQKMFFMSFCHGRETIFKLLQQIAHTLFLIVCKNIDLAVFHLSSRFAKRLSAYLPSK